MKSALTIDALKQQPLFQVNENDNPPNLADIDIEDDVEIVAQQDNDTGILMMKRLRTSMV